MEIYSTIEHPPGQAHARGHVDLDSAMGVRLALNDVVYSDRLPQPSRSRPFISMKKLLEAGCKLHTDSQGNWVIKKHGSLVVFAMKVNEINAVTRMVASTQASEQPPAKKEPVVLRAHTNDVVAAPSVAGRCSKSKQRYTCQGEDFQLQFRPPLEPPQTMRPAT
jgi:hypothetical protein